MQIVLRGPAAGYEAEHTARIFFPGAEKAGQVPAAGDFVLTSGSEIFPKDLVVGRIVEIQTENSGVSLYAEIQTSVDIQTITDVMVITDFEGQGVQ